MSRFLLMLSSFEVVEVMIGNKLMISVISTMLANFVLNQVMISGVMVMIGIVCRKIVYG